MSRIETTMTVTRIMQVVTFIDAAGDKTTEAQDYDLTVTVSGVRQRAEPDVGIMSDWIEDIAAEDYDGSPIELSDDEFERAQELLLDDGPDPDEAYERMRDDREF